MCPERGLRSQPRLIGSQCGIEYLYQRYVAARPFPLAATDYVIEEESESVCRHIEIGRDLRKLLDSAEIPVHCAGGVHRYEKIEKGVRSERAPGPAVGIQIQVVIRVDVKSVVRLAIQGIQDTPPPVLIVKF